MSISIQQEHGVAGQVAPQRVDLLGGSPRNLGDTQGDARPNTGGGWPYHRSDGIGRGNPVRIAPGGRAPRGVGV